MDKMRLQPKDITYFISHQPNLAFPVKVATQLGFKDEQFMPGLQVAKFGNAYSGSSPIGLAAVLDIAKPNDRIVIVSYGSGAGSDAYSMLVTDQIDEKRDRQKFTVRYQAENKNIEYVDYETYRRLKLGM
jgi:hydroxymethylglutaryl-CoA synthase